MPGNFPPVSRPRLHNFSGNPPRALHGLFPHRPCRGLILPGANWHSFHKEPFSTDQSFRNNGLPRPIHTHTHTRRSTLTDYPFLSHPALQPLR